MASLHSFPITSQPLTDRDLDSFYIRGVLLRALDHLDPSRSLKERHVVVGLKRLVKLTDRSVRRCAA
jgi:hypothetical protein